MNKAELLIQSIKAKGLSLKAVERASNVNEGTLRRWAKKPPKTWVMEDNIDKAIIVLSKNHELL